MSRALRVLSLVLAGLSLGIATSCDGDMHPVAAQDAGADDVGSYNNVRGYCTSLPQSCDDLIPGDDETELECCFGNVKYWCENGQLHFSECNGSCLYNTSKEEVTCQSAPSGAPQGPGGSTKPPTDPGPGF